MTDINQIPIEGYDEQDPTPDVELNKRIWPVGEYVSDDEWYDRFKLPTPKQGDENYVKHWFEHPKNRPVRVISPETKMYAIIESPNTLKIGDMSIAKPFFSINDAISHHRDTYPIDDRHIAPNFEFKLCVVNKIQYIEESSLCEDRDRCRPHYCIVKEIISSMSQMFELTRLARLRDRSQKIDDYLFIRKNGLLENVGYCFARPLDIQLSFYVPIYEYTYNSLKYGMFLRELRGYLREKDALKYIENQPNYTVAKVEALNIVNPELVDDILTNTFIDIDYAMFVE